MSAYKNTFWVCKDHTNFISTSCAICDEQRIAKLEAQLADMSLICADVRELTNLIVGSPPETPIKGQIESLAFELGHYPYVLNAQEKDNE